MNFCRAGLVMALACFVSAPLSAEEGIKCGDVLKGYNELFKSVNGRMAAVGAEFKALPAGADETPVRKKYCSVGGEMLGQYKGVQLHIAACTRKGESMGEVSKIVNEQVEGVQAVLQKNCE